MIKKADILLSASIIVLALLSVVFFSAFQKDGRIVRIMVNNKVYGEYRLDVDQTVVLAHNTIEIKDGTVSVSHADCRDQICVKKGQIRDAGESIVCLPNTVVVEVR